MVPGELIELPDLRFILEEELMEIKVHQILRQLCENVNCLVTQVENQGTSYTIQCSLRVPQTSVLNAC